MAILFLTALPTMAGCTDNPDDTAFSNLKLARSQALGHDRQLQLVSILGWEGRAPAVIASLPFAVAHSPDAARGDGHAPAWLYGFATPPRQQHGGTVSGPGFGYWVLVHAGGKVHEGPADRMADHTSVADPLPTDTVATDSDDAAQAAMKHPRAREFVQAHGGVDVQYSLDTDSAGAPSWWVGLRDPGTQDGVLVQVDARNGAVVEVAPA